MRRRHWRRSLMYGKVRIHYGVKPLLKLQCLNQKSKNNCEWHYCPIHLVTFTLISNLATDYSQKRSLASSLLNILCRQIWYQCKSDYMDRASVELGCINVPLAISHRNLKFVQHCAVRKFESDCFQHTNILNFRAYSRLQSRRRAENKWKIWQKRNIPLRKFALVELMTQLMLNSPTKT